MTEDLTRQPDTRAYFDCPLLPFIECSKKHKDCCRKFKKGDRCKKCPGRKK